MTNGLGQTGYIPAPERHGGFGKACPPYDAKILPGTKRQQRVKQPTDDPHDRNIKPHADGRKDYYRGEWRFLEGQRDFIVREWCINEDPGTDPKTGEITHFNDYIAWQIITSINGVETTRCITRPLCVYNDGRDLAPELTRVVELNSFNHLPKRISFISGNPHSPGDNNPKEDFHKTIYWIVDHEKVVSGIVTQNSDGSYTFSDGSDGEVGFKMPDGIKKANDLTEADKAIIIEDFKTERRDVIAKHPKLQKAYPPEKEVKPKKLYFVENRPRFQGCTTRAEMEGCLLNPFISLEEARKNFDGGASGGVLTLCVRCINISNEVLVPLAFMITAIDEHALLLDPDEGDGGVGSFVFLDADALGPGGKLDPKTSVEAEFRIALREAKNVLFKVDIYGVPLESSDSFLGVIDLPTPASIARM